MRYKIPSSSSSGSKKLFSTLLVSGIMTCCSSDPAPNQYPFLRNTSLSPPTSFSQFRRTNWSSPATIAEREFLVYFDPSLPAESVNRIHDEISSMGAQKIGNASLLRMIQYKADSGVDMNLLLDFALRQPGVLTAQPNFAVSPLVRLSPEVTGDVSDGYYLTYSTRGETPGIFHLDLNGNLVR